MDVEGLEKGVGGNEEVEEMRWSGRDGMEGVWRA